MSSSATPAYYPWGHSPQAVYETYTKVTEVVEYDAEGKEVKRTVTSETTKRPVTTGQSSYHPLTFTRRFSNGTSIVTTNTYLRGDGGSCDVQSS